MDELNANILFVLLWALSVGVCLFVVLRGWLYPSTILEWPFLISLISLYLFGYMAWEAYRNFYDKFDLSDCVFGQATFLLCMCAILAGWSIGKKKRLLQKSERRYDLMTICITGNAEEREAL